MTEYYPDYGICFCVLRPFSLTQIISLSTQRNSTLQYERDKKNTLLQDGLLVEEITVLLDSQKIGKTIAQWDKRKKEKTPQTTKISKTKGSS